MCHTPGTGSLCSNMTSIHLVRNEWVGDRAVMAGDTAGLGIPKKTCGHMGSCTE